MTPQHVPGVPRKAAEQSPTPLQQSSHVPLATVTTLLLLGGASSALFSSEEEGGDGTKEVALAVVELLFVSVMLLSELVLLVGAEGGAA